MKNLSLISIIGATVLLSTGCAVKSLNPSPAAVKVEESMPKPVVEMLTIKEGSTLNELIKQIELKANGAVVIDKTKNNLIFDRNIDSISIDELQSYIKIQNNRDIIVRKYSDKLFAVEEFTPELKKDYYPVGSYQPSNTNFSTKGGLSYEELFNVLRESGIQIDVELQTKPKPLSKTERKADSTVKMFPETQAPDFTGNIKSFLSFISAKEGLFVRTTDTGIILKDTDTFTYNLKLPKVKLDPALSPDGGKTAITGASGGGNSNSMSNMSSNTGVSNTMDTSTTTSGNNLQTQQTSTPGVGSTVGAGTLSPLDDIESQLKAMLGEKAVYAINMSAGTLSVTGNYEAIKTTDKIVQDFHDIYGKSIQLELNIYEVVVNDANSFGIDYTMLERDIVGSAINVTKNLSTSISSALIGTSSLSVTKNSGSVLTVTDNSNPTAPATSALEKTNGVVFKYLNKFGRASVITKPVLGTINNLPVKLDVVDSKDYVARLSNTNTTTTGANVATGVTTSEPQISTVTTGFSLIVHPKVENDYIKIALKSVVSNLNGFESYAYGTNKENIIQLKDVSSRQFEEMVKLKNNEIAIVGGYMYTRKASDKNGLPFTKSADSIFDAFSAAKSTTTEKVEIVMTIKARAI